MRPDSKTPQIKLSISPSGLMPMLKRWVAVLALLITQSNGALANESERFVIFDLDRTLFNPNPRIKQILHDLGKTLSIPELTTLSSDQIENLASGDRSALGITSPEMLQRLFGNYRDGSHRTSEWGRLFYFDSSYLIHDSVIPGGPEFVQSLKLETHAKIIYLSGRIKERFEKATWEQLKRAGFPGSAEAELILKPAHTALSNDEFKIQALHSRLQGKTILAIFDDSSRNLLTFKKIVAPSTPLIRLVRNQTHESLNAGRILQILDYERDASLLAKIFNLRNDCNADMKGPKP